MTEYCCTRLQKDLEGVCDIHVNEFDCPDRLIYKRPKGKYGLIVHDGGESSISIDFCPWCGKFIGSSWLSAYRHTRDYLKTASFVSTIIVAILLICAGLVHG